MRRRHSGMLPCFRAGLRSRLPSSIRKAPMTRGRVSEGMITSSTYPLPAATYGFANVSSYSRVSSSSLAAWSSAWASSSRKMMLDGALDAHDRDARRRPRQVDVAPDVLRAHDVVGAAVRLAGDDRHLGHRRLAVGVEQLGAVADDAAVLLGHAGQEAGHVLEGQQRHVEGIAHAHEPRRLVRGVDVQRAREHRGLLRHDADARVRRGARSR